MSIWQRHTFYQCLPSHPRNDTETMDLWVYIPDLMSVQSTHQSTQNTRQLTADFLSHQMLEDFVIGPCLLHQKGSFFNLWKEPYSSSTSFLFFHNAKRFSRLLLTTDRRLATSDWSSFSFALNSLISFSHCAISALICGITFSPSANSF